MPATIEEKAYLAAFVTNHDNRLSPDVLEPEITAPGNLAFMANINPPTMKNLIELVGQDFRVSKYARVDAIALDKRAIIESSDRHGCPPADGMQGNYSSDWGSLAQPLKSFKDDAGA
jgi:hypothetical protein